MRGMWCEGGAGLLSADRLADSVPGWKPNICTSLRRFVIRPAPTIRPTRPHGLAVQDACLSRRKSRVRIPLGVLRKVVILQVLSVALGAPARRSSLIGTTFGYQTVEALGQKNLGTGHVVATATSWTRREGRSSV